MSNETLEKPPIGVMPLWLWRELHPNPTPAQIFTREMEVMFAIDRYVAADGVRLMALLSRFLEDGQDPVALVAQLLAEAGYDTQGAEFDSEPEEDEGEEAAAE
jgi:hypothetical protein